jgi:hypothetical protein
MKGKYYGERRAGREGKLYILSTAVVIVGVAVNSVAGDNGVGSSEVRFLFAAETTHKEGEKISFLSESTVLHTIYIAHR